MSTTKESVKLGFELLNQLLSLQSEKDGVPRSPIGVVGDPAGHDKLAQDVGQVALLLFAAQQSIPLIERLTLAGRDLEVRGLITVDHGDSYTEKALDLLIERAASMEPST